MLKRMVESMCANYVDIVESDLGNTSRRQYMATAHLRFAHDDLPVGKMACDDPTPFDSSMRVLAPPPHPHPQSSLSIEDGRYWYRYRILKIDFSVQNM